MIESRAGAVVGVEVKAKASLQPADLRGLKRFASQAGDRFLAGLLLYDGLEPCRSDLASGRCPWPRCGSCEGLPAFSPHLRLPLHRRPAEWKPICPATMKLAGRRQTRWPVG